MRFTTAFALALCCWASAAWPSPLSKPTPPAQGHAAAPSGKAGAAKTETTGPATAETHAPGGKPATGDAVPTVVIKEGTAAPGARPRISTVELARRLEQIIASESAKASPRSAAARARRPAAKPEAADRPMTRLRWEDAGPEAGLQLAWDYDLDPRRQARPRPGGVRLSWPDQRP
jgi:hypothetical protein